MMRALIVIGLAVAVSACSTVSYYAHSISNQLHLLSSREPIERLLVDPALDESIKRRLRQTQAIRDFASRALALPDNDSYRSYVQLQRPYVAWSLFATPEFSVVSRQWCFPIAGCVPYRGYFNQAAAQAFAQALRAQGDDVFVGGVTAYSTLGWFDDPLLSTMLRQGETGTASIIFHELAHQAVYVAGDAPFNEAFATAVENAGVRHWLKGQGRQDDLRAYEAASRRRQGFLDLIEKTRAHLVQLYHGGKNRRQMRSAKHAILRAMQTDYRRLKRRWKGFRGYDIWFKEPINNAKLAAMTVYRTLVPDFERLLAACNGDFARFYREVAALAALGARARRERLTSASTCSSAVDWTG
jgi:predicted aminopeptidase